MKYRKRTGDIDAIQYTRRTNYKDIVLWVGQRQGMSVSDSPPVFTVGPDDTLNLETPEGTMTVDVGSWIIRGVTGEFNSVKADVFAITYEPVR